MRAHAAFTDADRGLVVAWHTRGTFSAGLPRLSYALFPCGAGRTLLQGVILWSDLEVAGRTRLQLEHAAVSHYPRRSNNSGRVLGRPPASKPLGTGLALVIIGVDDVLRG